MSHQFKTAQLIPQPYSRISTPVPFQPFTPPANMNPGTPGMPGSAGYQQQRLQRPIGAGNSSVNLAAMGGASEAQTPGNTSFSGIQGGGADGSAGPEVANGLIQAHEYEKPQVSRWLNEFEKTLAQLVESISRFRPSLKTAESLVSAEAELAQAITELAEHQQLARRIYELRQESKTLDDELNVLLVTLSDCRRTLRALPKPDEKFLRSLPDGALDYTRELVQLNDGDYDDEDEDEDEEMENNGDDGSGRIMMNGTSGSGVKKTESSGHRRRKVRTLEEAIRRRRSSLAFSGKYVQERAKVSAKELLEYATRITKFTSAPPGFDGQSRDNPDFNYPWPSEDELRRGMLALAALSGTQEVADGEEKVKEELKQQEAEREKEKPSQEKEANSMNVETMEPSSVDLGPGTIGKSSTASASTNNITTTTTATAAANNIPASSLSASSGAATGTAETSGTGSSEGLSKGARRDSGYSGRPSMPAVAELDLGLFDPDEDEDEDFEDV